MHRSGIYFGMSDEEYHSDESFSTSGIRKVLESPEQYWYESHMNPDRPEQEERDCLERGKLWHCAVLEPEHFDSRYLLAKHLNPSFSDNHIILNTINDMKSFLDDEGVHYNKSGSKEYYQDLIEMCSPLGKKPYLIDQEKEELAVEAAITGKTPIYSKALYEDMKYAKARIDEHPVFSNVVQGGHSEVAIFWTDPDTGIRMKAKIDKLHPHVIVDYKTMMIKRTKGMDQSILDAIRFEKYDLQAAMYTIGIAHVVNMINDGTAVIEGDVSGEFIDSFKQKAEKPFGFIFQQSEKPCAVRGRVVKRNHNDLHNVFGAGMYHMQRGIEIYQYHKEAHGSNRWVDTAGMMDIRDDEIYYYFT